MQEGGGRMTGMLRKIGLLAMLAALYGVLSRWSGGLLLLGEYKEVVIPALMLAVGAVSLWGFRFRAMGFYGSLALLTASVSRLKVINGQPYRWAELAGALSFASLVVAGLLLWLWFFSPERPASDIWGLGMDRTRNAADWSRRVARGAVYLAAGLLFVWLLLPWGYYSASHALLTPDLVLTVFQTNPGEAASFLRDQGPLRWGGLLLGILVCAGFVIHELRRLSAEGREGGRKLAAVLLVGMVAYSAVLVPRVPDFYTLDLGMDVRKSLDTFRQYREGKAERMAKLEELRNSGLSIAPGEGGIYVLVIGESVTRDHWSLYGYGRPTTPWAEQMAAAPGTVWFPRAYANYTHTVPSLSYALSAKNQYNDVGVEEAYSLLEVAKAAGYRTYWLSNQLRYGLWDTPVSAMASTADEQVWINGNVGGTTATQAYDGELVRHLAVLDLARNSLVVVHLMGSHATYNDRYPGDKAVFREDMKENSVDAYDNSIRYTDDVFRDIYGTVSSRKDFRALVYFSDHGEDAEGGRRHESSKFIWTMARIPMVVTLSPSFLKQRPETVKALEMNRDRGWTNDLVYNLMTDLMGIQGAPLQEDRFDAASPGYGIPEDRLSTLHGKRKISEDVPRNASFAERW